MLMHEFDLTVISVFTSLLLFKIGVSVDQLVVCMIQLTSLAYFDYYLAQ